MFYVKMKRLKPSSTKYERHSLHLLLWVIKKKWGGLWAPRLWVWHLCCRMILFFFTFALCRIHTFLQPRLVDWWITWKTRRASTCERWSSLSWMKRTESSTWTLRRRWVIKLLPSAEFVVAQQLRQIQLSFRHDDDILSTRWIKSWKWFPGIGAPSFSLQPWPRRYLLVCGLLKCSVKPFCKSCRCCESATDVKMYRIVGSCYAVTHTDRPFDCLQVQKLQRAALKDPVKCAVSTKYSTVDKLQQYYIFIPAKYKVALVVCIN